MILLFPFFAFLGMTSGSSKSTVNKSILRHIAWRWGLVLDFYLFRRGRENNGHGMVACRESMTLQRKNSNSHSNNPSRTMIVTLTRRIMSWLCLFHKERGLDGIAE